VFERDDAGLYRCRWRGRGLGLGHGTLMVSGGLGTKIVSAGAPGAVT
jgi:hypothetical protein